MPVLPWTKTTRQESQDHCLSASPLRTFCRRAFLDGASRTATSSASRERLSGKGQPMPSWAGMQQTSVSARGPDALRRRSDRQDIAIGRHSGQHRVTRTFTPLLRYVPLSIVTADCRLTALVISRQPRATPALLPLRSACVAAALFFQERSVNPALPQLGSADPAAD